MRILRYFSENASFILSKLESMSHNGLELLEKRYKMKWLNGGHRLKHLTCHGINSVNYSATNTRSKQEEGVKKLFASTHNPPNHRETPRLPPFHYCPERHYHRDCPVLTRRMANPPSENWRRAAEESIHE